MADGTTKPIDQVRVGDKVDNAQPGAKRSSKDEQHTVTAVHVTHDDRAYTDVTVRTAHGKETITGTAYHLYWDASAQRWTQARQLRVGDHLQSIDGDQTVIAALHSYTTTMITYNLTIDTLHTFFVETASIPVLVHNCGPTRTIRQLSEARPAHGTNEVQSARLKILDEPELRNAVKNPENGEPITLRTTDNTIMQGNHRVAELIKRAADPDSDIHWDEEFSVSLYTPDNSMFPELGEP